MHRMRLYLLAGWPAGYLPPPPVISSDYFILQTLFWPAFLYLKMPFLSPRRGRSMKNPRQSIEIPISVPPPFQFQCICLHQEQNYGKRWGGGSGKGPNSSQVNKPKRLLPSPHAFVHACVYVCVPRLSISGRGVCDSSV